METVRLYTRQDIRSLKEIEEKGYFTNKISYVKENFGVISDYILGCYNYFVKEASKEVTKICGHYYAYDSQIVVDDGEYYGVPCMYYKAKSI